jgi:hypothetical protein
LHLAGNRAQGRPNSLSLDNLACLLAMRIYKDWLVGTQREEEFAKKSYGATGLLEGEGRALSEVRIA